MQGFLIIDKPAGITSHDVVRRVRRAAGMRRVGHAGTLDPMATGLLPVALGDATRLIEYFSDREKGYSAVMRLGSETDTQDSEGVELAAADWSGIDAAQVEAALVQFRGEIEQIPPMYSALKKDGVPLYKLARQGIEIERPVRKMTIHSLEMTGFAPPEVCFDVVCSKGTYVRTLCHDLGRTLGCFAHMTGLRRFLHGRFDLSSAVSLEEVEQRGAENLSELLLSPLDALNYMPRCSIEGAAYDRLLNGIPPAFDEVVLESGHCRDGDLVCLTQGAELLAVVRYEPQRQTEIRGDFRLQKVFHPQES
jgi:tRNA pseudouridine55 synthase